MIKLSKQDAGLLEAVAADNVHYVPGRERATGAPTKYSFQRYAPATVGFKDWKRCTAPVNRLVEAGLAELADPSGEHRCKVVLTNTGRKWLAANAPAEAPAQGVTGQTARPGDVCGRCNSTTSAVSTFMIDGKVFGHACERHIIEVHGMAEKSAAAPTYVRGAKTRRSPNLSNLPVGAKILVHRTLLSHVTGTSLAIAAAKTGAIIVTVTGKTKVIGQRCYRVTTDAGVLLDSAWATTWEVES